MHEASCDEAQATLSFAAGHLMTRTQGCSTNIACHLHEPCLPNHAVMAGRNRWTVHTGLKQLRHHQSKSTALSSLEVHTCLQHSCQHRSCLFAQAVPGVPSPLNLQPVERLSVWYALHLGTGAVLPLIAVCEGSSWCQTYAECQKRLARSGRAGHIPGDSHRDT